LKAGNNYWLAKTRDFSSSPLCLARWQKVGATKQGKMNIPVNTTNEVVSAGSPNMLNYKPFFPK
jgi:hypothetical protein